MVDWLTRYTPERFRLLEKSRPRAEVAVLTNQLRELFASTRNGIPPDEARD